MIDMKFEEKLEVNLPPKVGEVSKSPISASALYRNSKALVLEIITLQSDDEEAWDYAAQGGSALGSYAEKKVYSGAEIYDFVKGGRMVYVLLNGVVFSFERYFSYDDIVVFGSDNYSTIENIATLDLDEIIPAMKTDHYLLMYDWGAPPETIIIDKGSLSTD